MAVYVKYLFLFVLLFYFIFGTADSFVVIGMSSIEYIEMVMFIKSLRPFSGIPGSILSDLADKIIPVDLRAQDKIIFNNPDENRPILICATGQVRLREGTKEVGMMEKGDVIGDLFQEGPSIKITEVEAMHRSVVFRINLPDFYFVMAKHHELVQGLVRNVTSKHHKTIGA